MEIKVRQITSDDRPWVENILASSWGTSQIVTRGILHDAITYPGLIAISKNAKVGLLIFQMKNDECEIISLNSLVENSGIGSALLESAEELASRRGCKAIWLITTNDNLRALTFYQRRGYALVAVHFDAIEVSRQLKPSIPMIGENDIPICDEIELRKRLSIT